MRYIVFLIVLICAGCCCPKVSNSGTATQGTNTAEKYLTIPIEPVPFAQTINAQLGTNYPNVDFTMVLQSFDVNGNAHYATIGANIDANNFNEIIDFKQYGVAVVSMPSGPPAFLHVGMAYRAVLSYAGVNASASGSIGVVGFGTAVSNVQGQISFHLYGLKNQQALASVPAPSAATPDKIEEYFQSLAIVKNLGIGNTAGSNDSQIDPQVVAVNPNGHTLDEVMERIYEMKSTNAIIKMGNSQLTF